MRPATALTFVLLALATSAPSAGAVTAPDPGGSETATVALPAPGKLMGFNDDMVGGYHGLASADYLELARTAGGNAARTMLDWRAAEPTRGAWHAGNWAGWKAFYDGALNRGMTPVFVVAFAPTWARDPEQQACTSIGACEFPPARSHDDDWARFVAEVASRFPKAVIEVWNEANLRFSWDSGPDPQRFAELQAIAYDAVKAVSPSTIVLAGGLANTQETKNGHIALREFLDRAYGAQPSIRGHMDAISFHPYPWSLAFGADTLFAKSFDDVRSVRAAHGDDATPLFVTEVGLPTIPDLLSEGQQADAMLRLYRRTMTMNDVLGVIFHRAIEPKDTSSDQLQWWHAWTYYGQNPAVPRPVYCRFVVEARRSYPGCPGELPLTVTLKSAPPATTSSTTATFAFDSPNYGATYQCALDNSAFSACWSPTSYKVGGGRHTFSVRARSHDGKLGAATKHTFRVRG